MLVTELEHLQEKCTGCFACMNICSQNAISMILNSEGFYYPRINEKLCINCGKCEKVCQITHNVEKYNTCNNIFYFQADDSIRMKSSSGGAFYYFAKHILEENGIVYGAVFDSSKKRVIHTNTENVSLESMMRSKYVQSDINNSYCQVKKDLNDGKKVLFSGTPCQIHGLNNYLGNKYDNLIMIDFVCHGVPSAGFFGDMIKYYENKERASVINVTFREKDLGWRDQVTKLYFNNGKVLCEKSSYYYYYLFLHNCTLRKSCYSCRNPEEHISDITVMDYWQVKNDDNKGTSVICVNTDKGNKLFESLVGEFTIGKMLDKTILSSAFLRHSKIGGYRRSIFNRKSFFKYYMNNGFEKTLSNWYPKYLKKSKVKGKFYIYGGKCKFMIKKIIRRQFRHGI